MVNIRTKGARGEREIIELFRRCMEQVEATFELPEHMLFSQQLKRNSMQSDSGGHDIVGIPGLAAEVKRAERVNVKGWWEQCCRQAARSNLMPILFYRGNRMQWRVRCYVLMPEGRRWFLGEMSADEFMDWYADYYRATLREKISRQ